MTDRILNNQFERGQTFSVTKGNGMPLMIKATVGETTRTALSWSVMNGTTFLLSKVSLEECTDFIKGYHSLTYHEIRTIKEMVRKKEEAQKEKLVLEAISKVYSPDEAKDEDSYMDKARHSDEMWREHVSKHGN